MASDNETVAEALELTKAIFFKDIGAVNERCQWCRDKLSSQLDRIESAHRREVAELRECLKGACSVACSCGSRGCKGAFGFDSLGCLSSKCEYHRWRKELEGEKDEGK